LNYSIQFGALKKIVSISRALSTSWNPNGTPKELGSRMKLQFDELCIGKLGTPCPNKAQTWYIHTLWELTPLERVWELTLERV
jgi:hypothetical protein